MAEKNRKTRNVVKCSQYNTGRKQTKEALKESEARFRSVLENSRDMIYRLNLQTGRYDYISPACEALTGYSPAELKEADVNIARSSIHPDDLPILREATMRAQETGTAEARYRQRTKQGDYIWVSNRMSTIKDDTGKPLYRIGNLRDITEAKHMREALEASEEKYRSLFENMTQNFVICEIILDSTGNPYDYRFLEANPAALKSANLSKEYIGKTLREITPLVDTDLINIYGKVVLTGEPAQFEHFGVVTKRWFSVSVQSFKKGCFTVFSHDITARKQAEEALTKARDELEGKVKERTNKLVEANKQLKQFSHRITQVQEEERKRIAYELHDDTAQYLSILKMQIGALAESSDIQSPKVKEKLQFLEKDADRAFNDVRRYSHELRPTTLEHQGLSAALEQIAEDFSKLGQLAVEVHAEGMEPELPEEIKLGFFRVAQEALNNTRKHAKASRVDIDIQFNHEQLKMTVSDNGEGFETQQALKKSAGKGSLGLLSMMERADLISADLTIESQPGKGTKVTLKAKL